MRNLCKADNCLNTAKPSKSFVHLFKGGRGRSPQRAKFLKLTIKTCCKSVITIKSKGAIHTKTVKQNVRNQFRKPKNVNCANSIFLKKYPLQANMLTK